MSLTKRVKTYLHTDFSSHPNDSDYLSRDYQLLGLEPSESRAEVIRSAVEQKALRLCEGIQPMKSMDCEARIASLSLAAYHLLDPRRRKSLDERVLLCYPIDRDEYEPKKHRPLSILVVPSSGEKESSPCRELQPRDRQVIRAMRDRSLRRRTARPSASFGELEESRRLVRFLKLTQRQRRSMIIRQWTLWFAIPTLVGFAFALVAACMATLNAPL